MNKIKLWIIGILGASLITLFVFGCGDTSVSPTDELVATWELTRLIMTYSIGGVTVTDTLTPEEDTISGTITLNEDSTFTSTLEMQGQVTNLSGNWTTDGDSLTLSDETTNQSITVYYDVSGSTLETSGEYEVQGIPVPIKMTQIFQKKW